MAKEKSVKVEGTLCKEVFRRNTFIFIRTEAVIQEAVNVFARCCVIRIKYL